MIGFFKRHWLYFSLIVAFILVGGLYLGASTKDEAIIFFSDRRSTAGDWFFRFTTLLGEAYLYFIFALAALTVRLRYTLLIAMTGFMVLLVSFGLKSYFKEDRPLAYFTKEGLVEKINFVQGVDIHSGATSLPSGHTMSAFALYGLLAFLLPKRKRFAATLFLLALAVGFSRVYLVQHFWRDVYWGAIIGTVLAMVMYTLHIHFENRQTQLLDKKLMDFYKRKIVSPEVP